MFDGGNIDKACLQYIYMDMIRSHIHNFIEVNNSHRIRKQKKSDHYLPTGKPFEMYFYPDGVEDFKEPIEEEVLVLLESEVGSFDLDSFLPTETLNLFSNFLTEENMPDMYTYDNPQHRKAYLILRQKVWTFVQTGGIVGLLANPIGAADWIEQNQRGIVREEIHCHLHPVSGDVSMQAPGSHHIVPSVQSEYKSDAKTLFKVASNVQLDSEAVIEDHISFASGMYWFSSFLLFISY